MNRLPIFTFDTETTGLNPYTCGILTLGACIVTTNLDIVKPIHLKIKVDPDKYEIAPAALEKNGINLEEHNASPDSLEPNEAQMVIHEYILQAKLDNGLRYSDAIPLMGHNVDFDINFLREFQDNLYDGITFPGFKIDTMSMLNQNRVSGGIDIRSIKLDKVAPMLGLTASDITGEPETFHNAMTDAVMCAKLYVHLRERGLV